MKKGWVIGLVLAILCLFFLRLVLGSVTWNLEELLNPSEAQKVILFKYRLPHALTALLAGSILALCGLLMQTIFRNPLAGPFVLGVSSGASLVVALSLMVGLSWLSTFGLSVAAIMGSLGVVLLISLISLRYADNFTLLIFGLMLGYVFSALQGLTEYFGEARSLKSFVVWGLGSFGKVQDLVSFVFLVLLLVLLVIFLSRNSRKFDFYSLGDDYAALEGVKVKRLKILSLILVGVAAGVVTGLCGPIAFLGIAVPHLAAMLIKTKRQLPWMIHTALLGAVLALFCDVLAEVPFADITFPINVVTSLIGAPVVIWVLLKGKKHWR